MSLQISILKILDGQPDGRASLAVVKQYLAVFYGSGSEWTDRMKRLAQRAPNLDIFGQRLIVRERGEWLITAKGRALLLALERSSTVIAEGPPSDQPIEHLPVGEPSHSSAQSRRRITIVASNFSVTRWCSLSASVLVDAKPRVLKSVRLQTGSLRAAT